MSYTALYRRLRPVTFAGIVDQDRIVTTLKNQIITGRTSHAYLFCGARGTGKTTTALVLGKAVNCEAPAGGEPCGVCEACVAIEKGKSLNIIEIDAASNNGVDNIRDIREEVKYPPVKGKYKAYIIDEVHMLSSSAFNALLKTLEEPPSGVLFILATTDPQKIPATVLSRCQRFDFKRLRVEPMAVALEGYLKDEGIEFEPDAVRHAARISDGSMRDALSLLDQCSSYYMGERVTVERLMEITGSVDPEVFSRLAAALSQGDAAACLNIINDIAAGGKDFHQAVTEFTAHLRNLLVAKLAKDSGGLLLDRSEANLEELRRQSAGLTVGDLTRYVGVFSELLGRMRYAGNPRLLWEAEVIRQAGTVNREPETGSPEPEPKPIPKPKSESVKKTAKTPDNKQDKQDSEQTTTVLNANTGDDGIVARLIGEWDAFIAGFGALERGLLVGTKAERGEGSTVNIVCDSAGVSDILKAKQENIRVKIKERFGADVGVNLVVRKDGLTAKALDKLTDMIDMDIEII